MAQLIGIANLGRDAEVRYTPSGQAVMNLALAFNYGKKGDDGNRPTQWVDAALWGQRAESLGQYMTRGQKVYVVIDDIHIETYEGQNGQGHKLVGNISTIEFAGAPRGQDDGGDHQQTQRQPQQRQGGQQQRQAQGNHGQRSAPPQQRQQQAPRQQQPQTNSGDSGFSDMDDDIPF
jgi:single-strand DNA-binding protein